MRTRRTALSHMPGTNYNRPPPAHLLEEELRNEVSSSRLRLRLSSARLFVYRSAGGMWIVRGMPSICVLAFMVSMFAPNDWLFVNRVETVGRTPSAVGQER